MGRRSRRFHRSTYLDWRDELLEARRRAKAGRCSSSGASQAWPRPPAAKIRAEYPGVTLGVQDGYFDMAPGSAENGSGGRGRERLRAQRS